MRVRLARGPTRRPRASHRGSVSYTGVTTETSGRSVSGEVAGALSGPAAARRAAAPARLRTRRAARRALRTSCFAVRSGAVSRHEAERVTCSRSASRSRSCALEPLELGPQRLGAGARLVGRRGLALGRRAPRSRRASSSVRSLDCVASTAPSAPIRLPSAAKKTPASGSRRAASRNAANAGIDLVADREHAEPVAVREREAGVPLRELVPEAPHAEVALADARVVEQHDAAVAQLRQPRLDVVRDGLVRVAAVDVEQVDRAVGEASGRLVERLREQARERAVERVVVRAQLLEHLRPVLARCARRPRHVSTA